ncbi:ABC bile acid transporter [Niveomyces insectorum RCEF 264]|uniref:ABC bile acid transporter n=1 Tax=Niveomyces insectorum RCEF 264 TaxID=1081102 RepID=A0A167RVN3_9HYPO|nr:ABC bile acid transporter [Niveomyces insectorum RCEF 264]
MGLASCSWPIWRVDDFTVCFQRDYLQTLLPIIILCLSFSVAALQTIRRAVRLKKQKSSQSAAGAYQQIRTSIDRRPSAAQRTELPLQNGILDSDGEINAAGADDGGLSGNDDDDDVENDDEGLSMAAGGGGRINLVRTTTKGSIVQADKPVGQTLSTVVEELAIVGLIVVNAIALSEGAFSGHGAGFGGGDDDNDGDDLFASKGRLPALVGLFTWIYTAVLVALRLVSGSNRSRIPHLWNHTAAIYALQWLFTVVLFRSVLINPTSRVTEVLVIVEFALTSLLFTLAITTRKGNKTVLIQWEDGLPPSRENLASLLSHFTFSWVDAIVWEGYKEPLEMERIWNLLPKDKAAAVLARYRRAKKTSSLAFHLLKFFKGELLVQTGWAIMSAFFTFAPTMLLKAILEYVEHPEIAPRNVLWLYVILLPVTDLIRSFGDNRALWVGRKICINIRAILVGEIYAKALRRKAAAGNDTVLGADKSKDASTGDKPPTGWLAPIKRIFGGRASKKDTTNDRNGAAAQANATEVSAAAAAAANDANDKLGADEQANVGTIINLMSVDSFKVSEVTAYLHFLVAAAPMQLAVSVFLLYRVMGVSAIPGFIVMALLLPINIAFAKAFNLTQKRIMAATDKRIHATNEVLQNIRIVKYFAWELRFGDIVGEKRRVELHALRQRFIVWACAVAVWNAVPILITFCCFFIYTVVEGKPLYPSVAFTAISLFMLLRYPLDQLGDMIAHVQESQVSIDRIEEFLSEEETEKFDQLGFDNIDETTGERVIGFRNNASFIWGGRGVVADDGSMAFRLLDLNVDFVIGKLNVITGPTGSGKTSMLMALLGEMTLLNGRVFLPGGRSREDVRPDPETGLAETCAYVAQQAWLVNGTIKENILFASPFDEQRYRDVIVACALEHDLHETLDNGDETLVGEKGITLSGGQKQRISLARALYSNSRHLLLDDCFSAVDSHTAQWIFNNCIRGPLMRGRTCILVTHNVSLCVPYAEYVVAMNNGRIAGQGYTQDVIASGKLGEDLMQKLPTDAADISRIPSRVPSSVGDEAESGDSTTLIDNGGAADPSLPGSNGHAKKQARKQNGGDRKQTVLEETKATGAVKWPVMKLYLGAMGSWWFWVVAALVFSLQQFSLVASNIWIKIWSNEYTEESTNLFRHAASSNITWSSPHSSIGQTSFVSPPLSHAFSPNIANYLLSVPQQWMPKNSTVFGTDSALSAAMSPEVNVHYYLLVLAIIGLAGSVLALIRDLWIFFGSLTASWKLHDRLMHYVSFARFKFFDVTPLGQMMNRFSKDLEAVDQEVAPVAIGVMTCALGIVITIVLIAVVTPGFLVAGVFITALYVFLGKFYLNSSRDLKRLESVQRSPLFQQFGETLSGVSTIRAYGDERRFVRDNLARINAQIRPFIYLWAANRWLAFRTDVLGDLVSFFAGVFVILSLGVIDPGSAGISLSYAIGFAENILWLVRLYAMNEQNMNSVERIKEYLDVEQEAPAVIDDSRPPANWPSQGAVEFVDYSTRYRADLEPVLRGLTFRIAPHEKVGIVGRTGAGKSSLALALFRALEADSGKILVDGIDIGLIGLRDLREALTIVPQEPTLFTGTIRSNLDPFHAYTDEVIFGALRRVQLIGPDESIPSTPRSTTPPPTNTADSTPSTPATATNKNVFLDLSSPVAESGSNLSQGQRQLLCLARAMLKAPAILLMDEATASIDYATDSKIQETIREMTSTIITIAHRLQTIADYDKVLVLDRGTLVEYGHPWELMKKTDGVFRSMCDMSGDYETLAKVAKKAYQDKNLMDIDGEQ